MHFHSLIIIKSERLSACKKTLFTFHVCVVYQNYMSHSRLYNLIECCRAISDFLKVERWLSTTFQENNNR